MATRRARAGGARPQRVGEQIRQILSEALLSGALREPSLEAADLVSFTEVRVTNDLSLARVFTSVFPMEEEVVVKVMTGLQASAPRIRSLVAGEMRLRHTPELRFQHDGSMEHGARMEVLIREARTEDAALHGDELDPSDRTEPEDA